MAMGVDLVMVTVLSMMIANANKKGLNKWKKIFIFFTILHNS